MKKSLLLFAFAVGFLLFGFNSTLAQENIEVNFFYSPACPHCANEKVFLAEIQEKYPNVTINQYDVINSKENQALLGKFYEDYNVPQREQGYVPVTFTSTDYFIGFNDNIAHDIESCLIECLGGAGERLNTLTVPFLGEVDLSTLSLPVLTVTLAALDGLNPCAMWILVFILALLINLRSRKRMWLIGGMFIFVSGLIYFLILSAWLNFFLAISYVNLTRLIIGILAVCVGVWQIKTFITTHPGVCRAMGLRSRLEDRLKTRAEKIVSSPVTWAMLGGVILIAVSINLIEFFCSAGVPTIFTRVLTLSNLSTPSYYSYLLLYTFIFMLDDLIVFFLAMITFKKMGLTEKYNYWATLVGGILILALGLLLIFKPELLMFT
ncbi:MAG: hypothetical protein ABH805_02560 [Candidatus Nealsonbacteria bacterium]